MLNRFSAVWLLFALICGYALTGRSATAQNADNLYMSAFDPGNTIRLRLDRNSPPESEYVTCVVAEVVGRWIRCKSSDSFQEDREQQWYNLERVVQVTKRQKQ